MGNTVMGWQFTLAKSFEKLTLAIILLSVAMVVSYYNWLWTGLVLLLIGTYFIVLLIPILLTLSREFFKWILCCWFYQSLSSIVCFAYSYKNYGLMSQKGYFIPDFTTAIYFSITTFTTLGYGDFAPTINMRIVTSLEVLMGMVSTAFLFALIWFWCQENIIPEELTWLDGERRFDGTLHSSRVRIKDFYGVEKNLKKWKILKDDDQFYLDSKTGEWIQITKDTIVPENSLQMGVKYDDD